MHLTHPYRFDSHGHTATAAYDDYVRGLIEQVLFTAQGERVNRPEFGSGLGQLVFAPNSAELAGATQLLVQSSLQQTLGALIVVEAVDVDNRDAELRISVQYVIRRTSARQLHTFTPPGNA
jgi:phage baseplate assembly protein W